MGSLWEEGTYEPQILKETLHLLPWALEPPISSKEKTTGFNEVTTVKCTCGSNSVSSSTQMQENLNASTSNSTADRLENSNCTCKSNFKENQSIITEALISSNSSSKLEEAEYISKRRHISVDSARDSGIGENSNFTDIESCSKFESGSEANLDEEVEQEIKNTKELSFLNDENAKLDDENSKLDYGSSNLNYGNSNLTYGSSNLENSNLGNSNLDNSNLGNSNLDNSNMGSSNLEISMVGNSSLEAQSKDEVDSSQIGSTYGPTETDLRGYWQPKQKRSLTERLPADSFYLVPPSRYIFPGAEVYLDPDEKCNYFDDSGSDSSDSESEPENEPADNSF